MSFGRYSDNASASTGGGGHESYTDRFRVNEPVLQSTYRGGTESEPSVLVRMINRACDISRLEPNLSLNLEVADRINEKKGNAAREGAMQIVKLINSRSTTVSVLALALLDICVKNCGYPFHLQISRKEFLNELVRKLPKNPPERLTRTQTLILEAVEEWRQTICVTSRYKEDLGYIRDMHRLLSYMGYTFPEINMDDAAVLNPADTIKSAEELEEEERDAQSAKLQELIRRGRPADLVEANQLIKIIAGYDAERKTDFRAKAAEDIAKIQRKSKLLEEMLEGVQNGDAIGRQDAFEELYTAIKNAQPKIQKIIKDEAEDEEAVVKLLQLNDYMNTVVAKYEAIKASGRSQTATAPTTATAGAAPLSNEALLIDLDFSEPTAPAGGISLPISGHSPQPSALSSPATVPQGLSVPVVPLSAPLSPTSLAPTRTSSAMASTAATTQPSAASSANTSAVASPTGVGSISLLDLEAAFSSPGPATSAFAPSPAPAFATPVAVPMTATPSHDAVTAAFSGLSFGTLTPTPPAASPRPVSAATPTPPAPAPQAPPKDPFDFGSFESGNLI
ncbi:VHS domain-containing protein [Dipodascopsis tothii]|uniref:VHS domain-containing protein n=1 Tax=Dipodascopsis tothii TaxID=44089 RepID=UPI0034CE111E